MVKNILGVVVGYIAMAVFVFATFSIAYLLLGAECSFQPNSYNVSAWWIIISIVLSIGGAILGGFVCATIASSGTAPKVLAGIVLVLGIALAIPTLSDNPDRPTVRSGDVGNMEAMQSAHQPTWLAFLTPLIGATGVMMGSCMKKRK
jgi:hypothetical protein